MKKKEYYFSDDEKKKIVKSLINKRLLWNVRDMVFSATHKSSEIQIRTEGSILLIQNSKEVSRIYLGQQLYLDLVMGIQDMVTSD